MADPTLAGYNPSSSLIPQVAGDIKPMMGGGNEERDIKLFGKVYKIPNPASMNEADLDLNKNIQEIMKLLNFKMLLFEEKKKILQSLYDSNCTNETDLALSCGCDPVRKVIADLATLLLKKTSEKIELPTPVKRIDTTKKQVEISIRIPLEMIRVVMGSTSDISGATSTTPATDDAVKATKEDIAERNIAIEENTPEQKAAQVQWIKEQEQNAVPVAAPISATTTTVIPTNTSISQDTAIPAAAQTTNTTDEVVRFNEEKAKNLANSVLNIGEGKAQSGNAIGISMGGNNTRKLRLSNK